MPCKFACNIAGISRARSVLLLASSVALRAFGKNGSRDLLSMLNVDFGVVSAEASRVASGVETGRAVLVGFFAVACASVLDEQPAKARGTAARPINISCLILDGPWLD